MTKNNKGSILLEILISIILISLVAASVFAYLPKQKKIFLNLYLRIKAEAIAAETAEKIDQAVQRYMLTPEFTSHIDDLVITGGFVVKTGTLTVLTEGTHDNSTDPDSSIFVISDDDFVNKRNGVVSYTVENLMMMMVNPYNVFLEVIITVQWDAGGETMSVSRKHYVF